MTDKTVSENTVITPPALKATPKAPGFLKTEQRIIMRKNGAKVRVNALIS